MATVIDRLCRLNVIAVDCGSNYEEDDGPCYYDGPDAGIGSCLRHAALRLLDDVRDNQKEALDAV